MKYYIFQIVIFTFFISNGSYSYCENLNNKEKKHFPNLAILTIKGWQLISHNTDLINCQFEQSCSSYGIESVEKKGTLKGILYSTDRISRCHPFAYKYYQKNCKGELIDNFDDRDKYIKKNKSNLLLPLTIIIPGFNKMINGRFYDGLSTFIVVETSLYCSYKTYKNDSFFVYPISFVFSTFYISDIYFSFLTLSK